jgi:uncharacterized membrane protein YedE/YeeE
MLFALIGGALIGLSASVFWFVNARVAGISGILHGALRGQGSERVLKLAFLAGLLLAGLVFGRGSARVGSPSLGTPLLLVAGLLVGAGTRLANGCTSGHGVCGLSRLSLRSLVATLTFMLTAAFTVFLTLHVFGQLGGGR